MRAVSFALMTVMSALMAMLVVTVVTGFGGHPLAGLLGGGTETTIVEDATDLGVPEDAWLLNPDTHEPGTVPPLDEWLFTPETGIPSPEDSFRQITEAIDNATK